MTPHKCLTCKNACDWQGPEQLTETGVAFGFACTATVYFEGPYGPSVGQHSMLYWPIVNAVCVDGGQSIPEAGCASFTPRLP